MDRRQFLRMFGGAATSGLVASATMSEAGMLAEFLSWLKRKPVWSIPNPRSGALTYDQITALTAKYIVPRMADEIYKPSPIFVRLLQRDREIDHQPRKFDLKVA